jgi:hypothetical protein
MGSWPDPGRAAGGGPGALAVSDSGGPGIFMFCSESRELRMAEQCCDVTGTRDWPLPGQIQELAPDP